MAKAKRKSVEAKLAKILAEQRSSRCFRCSYFKDGYCADLDESVDPAFPICSEEYYNS